MDDQTLKLTMTPTLSTPHESEVANLSNGDKICNVSTVSVDVQLTAESEGATNDASNGMSLQTQQTPTAESSRVCQSQISPSSSSVAGSSKQQYQPAKCNEERIKKLLENSCYVILNENGQRRFCLPGLSNQIPNKGCEVFIGKLPPDMFEDELVPLLERVGKLRELRIMMEYSGTNRGYGFATYDSRDAAKQAVRELNNMEVRKGKTLGVCLSVDNCRLFVGGIPKQKLKDDVFGEMRQLTEGVVDVIMYPSASDKSKNRGFAFVEYDSHRSAAVARKKLMNGKAQLWGHPIAVDWAEPERFVDEDVMATVKILYVRNLMLSTTEEKLREVFSAACEKADAVERVKKIRDYAFIHFRDRNDALKCRDLLNNKQLEGTFIEVCLAKPVDKSERQQTASNASANALHGASLINSASVTPLLSSGLPMYFDPTMLAMAGGLSLPMPQVLGLPPVSPALIDPSKFFAMQAAWTAGRRSSSSNKNGRSSQNESRTAHGTKRRQQFIRAATNKSQQSATNSPASQLGAQKKPLEVLEELCQQHGLGSPVYNLHTVISHAGVDLQMYLFKVTIPAITITFTPNRLSVNIEEARQYAAEFVLQQLTQQSPWLTAPVINQSEDMRLALQNPATVLGNMGSLYPYFQLPQFVPTLSQATIAPYLLPPTPTMTHASIQNTHGQQTALLNGQVARPLDAAVAHPHAHGQMHTQGHALAHPKHATAAAQPPTRFDANAAQYYDGNIAASNATYLPAQPMQAGPQTNVAF